MKSAQENKGRGWGWKGWRLGWIPPLPKTVASFPHVPLLL